MMILEKISMPENGGCIALFYTWVNAAGAAGKYCPKKNRVIGIENLEKEKRCELFNKTELTSVGLNRHSFVLRFRDRSEKRSMKIHISDREQIAAISGMVEHTIGGGLKVVEHYNTLFAQSEQN